MQRIAVESTLLAWARYSADERILELGFRSGSVYAYRDVPPQAYQDLLCAESKGRYFNLHIRNDFDVLPVRTFSAR